MLQGIESEKGDSSNVFIWGVNPKDAAGLVEALQTALLSRLGCATPAGRDSHVNSIV
jgi:hypothetical protein